MLNQNKTNEEIKHILNVKYIKLLNLNTFLKSKAIIPQQESDIDYTGIQYCTKITFIKNTSLKYQCQLIIYFILEIFAKKHQYCRYIDNIIYKYWQNINKISLMQCFIQIPSKLENIYQIRT